MYTNRICGFKLEACNCLNYNRTVPLDFQINHYGSAILATDCEAVSTNLEMSCNR